ncbi:MAG: tetratricopeptide repeat protein [Candidatus Heimdallarchaeota archaeon]|nr:MAG: tetratricopeptide repeat protein [Candidatus Heimdallarchaeota archaeon]
MSNLEKGKELIRQVENSAAIPFFQEALKEDPHNPEIFRHLGLAYFNLGNYEDALLNWEKAIELDPTHHQTFWNLGHLHEIEQRYSDAFEAYSQAAIIAEEISDLKKAERYKEWAARIKSE